MAMIVDTIVDPLRKRKRIIVTLVGPTTGPISQRGEEHDGGGAGGGVE